MIKKTVLLRDREWLNKVRMMPCISTGYQPVDINDANDPAHIRHGFFWGGEKPPDNLALPLRHPEHERQHRIGEKRFWFEVMEKNKDFMMECVKAYARQLHREENQ